MGFGDQLMGSGLARGAKARGKRIALGDGQSIRWDHHSEPIFRNNPNLAKPGADRGSDIEWLPFYKGHRIYNTHDRENDRWVWNMDFHAQPGEMFFDAQEKLHAGRYGREFVLIEPNVVALKGCAPNKDWGRARYQAVTTLLVAAGYDVAQFRYPGAGDPLPGARQLKTNGIRDALAIIENAALYIGPEGGLHHGAAAAGIHGVVIFGGFIPPAVTGYETHTNLTGGATACGSLHMCPHCRDAMHAISVEEVHAAALERL